MFRSVLPWHGELQATQGEGLDTLAIGRCSQRPQALYSKNEQVVVLASREMIGCLVMAGGHSLECKRNGLLEDSDQGFMIFRNSDSTHDV